MDLSIEVKVEVEVDIASVYSDYAMDKSGHVFEKLTLVAISS